MKQPPSGLTQSPAPNPTGAVGHDVNLWALLDALPVPMLVHELGVGGKVRFVNPSFTAAFGHTLADIPTLQAWTEHTCPDPDYLQGVMARKATGAVMPPEEYRFLDKAGRPRNVLIGIALQGDLVIATFQDLTDTRAAEAALNAQRRANEQVAFALTENMPAGAYTMVLRPGAEWAEFVFVSKQFLQMLELTHEEALGDPTKGFSRVHADDRPRWLKINAEAFAKRLPISSEARIVANGETRWIRAEAVPRELDDGSLIWEGLLVDITPLKEIEARLKAVLEASRSFTWSLDLHTRRVTFDESWVVAHGYGPHLTLANWFEALHPDDAPAVKAGLQALGSDVIERQSMVYRRWHQDGHWHWMQVQAGISARDSDGKPVAISGVSFDITDEMTARAQAQEEQAQLREDLQRAQQRDTVAQIAGGVAHDLNNLIAVVAGTTEMLALQAKGQVWLQDGLGRIGRAVGMAHDLVAGLGGLVRPDQPREALDLCRLLRSGMDLLGQRRIMRHSVHLELPQYCPAVWANPTEVAQVIVNLAINACDAGTQERPATVTLATLPAGATLPPRWPDVGVPPPPGLQMALFTITDTGSGITDVVRAQMFRPNFTTKGKAGTGLGLLIVSTILQANRAALWVDSTPGLGTTMTVAWPAAAMAGGGAAPDGPDATAPSAATAPADLLRGLRVLVVDDLADVAEVLADMLESAGAVAVAVSDPNEAAQALTDAPGVWSALVTDLHMESMDGRTLARHAGTLTPPVPTVLVTARPDTLGDAPTTEFAAVLSKPVTAARLVRAVRAAADHARAVTKD